MPLEVERKYLNVDFELLRRSLQEQGAESAGAHFESNLIFDTAAGQLRANRRLLRLRTREWPGRIRHLLTLKLPVPHSEHFKVREEHELEIADKTAMQNLLEGMGYGVAARYEKIREPWRLEDVEVELDILPFANVVEMEGPAGRISSVQQRLGLDNAQISIKTYHQLHQDWRLRYSLPPALSFVFDKEQNQLWRQRLGLTYKAAPQPGEEPLP
ncbi:class IV adenylate cyclase [Desulfovibrio sp. ZJ369]|uniref:class IV adenylate cyclase n=1 Tax=Desulfovibrio sp. ZJ369 TaxID=2709793 RepID=UPI0013ED2799|nr:class IV adenylate cyclase [Desulfovibrio sp. ZJ369]